MKLAGYALGIGVFLTGGLPALAQQVCGKGNDSFLRAIEFSASPTKANYGDYLDLKVSLSNISQHSIRMIDGSIVFQDVLGRDILRIGIDPDIKVDAGETIEQSGLYSNLRLAEVAIEDVVVTTCIRAAVTSSGEVLKFDGN